MYNINKRLIEYIWFYLRNINLLCYCRKLENQYSPLLLILLTSSLPTPVMRGKCVLYSFEYNIRLRLDWGLGRF